ncbi:MAG TPA: SpoIVB peptidase S55 domain-containing protein [Kofleriaceae bacterium]|nr:SpoIVB peptidase S55 domain-containing protein [Kofleriaceae bacterium]
MRGFVRLCAVAGVLLCAGSAYAGPDFYPLSKVQRGQTGYGMSTFAGTKPERYTFEVISVVHNMLPKQDIILFKTDDPKVTPSGVWRGMSGSPLYIDDKLVCAVSYAWSFNKIAMGGCTPIEYMRQDGNAHRRHASTIPGPNGVQIVQPMAATMSDWRRLAPTVDVAAAMDALGPANKNWLLSAPLPPPVQKTGVADGQTMTAAVPLSVSGFSTPAFNTLTQLLSDSTLVPVRAGGTSSGVAEEGPKQFTPGGAIAVELIRGDMAAAGVGTVTHVDGNKVLAFGHPMFGNGEWYAPVSTAYVHTVITSMQSAFVMASARKEIGSLVQDRQAAISADTNLRAPMIPLDITVTTGSGKQTQKGTFHAELLDNKFLTPAVTGAAVMNAINYYLPDREDVTARVTSSVRIKGVQDPLTFVDYMYANDGAGSVMGSVRGLRVLVPLLMNPYAPVKVERVDINVDLRFEVNYGEVKEVRVPTTELLPGQRNLVEVKMTTYDGKDIYEKVPVDVPKDLAGSIVQLEVTSGDSAKLDAAPPVDLPSLIGAFRKLLPGNVWAVTLYPADEGVALEGKLVRDLPATAQDKLHPQSRTQRAQAYKPVARTLAPATRVIEGSSTMLVRVRAR